MKILYVEDETCTANLIKLMLESRGLEVITLKDSDNIKEVQHEHLDGMLADGYLENGHTYKDSIVEWKKYFPDKPFMVYTASLTLMNEAIDLGYDAETKGTTGQHLMGKIIQSFTTYQENARTQKNKDN